MTDTVTIPHPDIGPIRLTVEDDWTNLVTYYQVKAARVSGSVTAAWSTQGLYSDRRETTGFDTDDLTCFLIAYGRDCELGRPIPPRADLYAFTAREMRRTIPDPLTVNRVTLRSSNTFRWSSFRGWGELPLSEVWVDAPDATRTRTAAVLTAVARHWLTRDPHAHVLRLAAAQRVAEDWAAQCRDRIAFLTQTIAAARADIAAAEEDAADAAHLAAAPRPPQATPAATPNLE